jgi:hypothetical protein
MNLKKAALHLKRASLAMTNNRALYVFGRTLCKPQQSKIAHP